MFGYLITVILTSVAALAAAGVMIYQVVRLVLRQIKLYHSINLVELKTPKLIFWIFAGLLGALIIYTIMQMATANAPGLARISAMFGVRRLLVNLAFVAPLVAMISAEALMIMLGLGKNAVVDKGIYTNYEMLDWHQVRDYIIDEDRGILVLSADKNTFSTLKNLTTPFRVKKADVQKLKFILNKNKNKFSGFADE